VDDRGTASMRQDQGCVILVPGNSKGTGIQRGRESFSPARWTPPVPIYAVMSLPGRTADLRDGSGTRCPWKTPAGFMRAGGLDLETFVLQSRETHAPERARSALVTKKGGHNPPTNSLAERPGKLLRYCRE
jgi:hypothetical protein